MAATVSTGQRVSAAATDGESCPPLKDTTTILPCRDRARISVPATKSPASSEATAAIDRSDSLFSSRFATQGTRDTTSTPSAAARPRKTTPPGTRSTPFQSVRPDRKEPAQRNSANPCRSYSQLPLRAAMNFASRAIISSVPFWYRYSGRRPSRSLKTMSRPASGLKIVITKSPSCRSTHLPTSPSSGSEKTRGTIHPISLRISLPESR